MLYLFKKRRGPCRELSEVPWRTQTAGHGSKPADGEPHETGWRGWVGKRVDASRLTRMYLDGWGWSIGGWWDIGVDGDDGVSDDDGDT